MQTLGGIKAASKSATLGGIKAASKSASNKNKNVSK